MFIAMILWLVAASAAPSAPVISNPDWAETPDGDEIADHYPIKAWSKGIGGGATILCRVNSFGRLNNCSVVRESPGGYGFGLAAVELSGLFRMKPATIDGQPVSGAWVRIPIAFAMEASGQDPVERLNDAIQCYGLFASLRGAEPENATIARAAEGYRAWAAEQAVALGVTADQLDARLEAARASPPTKPDLVDWCRTS